MKGNKQEAVLVFLGPHLLQEHLLIPGTDQTSLTQAVAQGTQGIGLCLLQRAFRGRF